MTNQKPNTKNRREIAALTLECELITRENKLLARIIKTLDQARKAGRKASFSELLAAA